MKSDRSYRSVWVLAAAFGVAVGGCAKSPPGTHLTSEPPATAAPAAADRHFPSSAGHSQSSQPAGGAPHWEYEGQAGPEAWGALSADFATCSAGRHQSPIDLAGASPVG